MKNLAIIPARGGSKRLPGKNVKLLCGRPLIHYTIDAAIESDFFSTIIVSSDSDKILDISSKINKRVKLHKRPAYLSSDTSTVLTTVQKIFESENEKGNKYDTISLLLPTAPLRTSIDIKAAFDILSKEIDSVVSITEFNFPPQLGLMIDPEGMLQPYHSSDPFRKGRTRSQDYPTVYRPNGAIYISWWKSFEKNQNFFKGKVASYFMPQVVSADIDTELDMIIASETIRYYNLPVNLE